MTSAAVKPRSAEQCRALAVRPSLGALVQNRAESIAIRMVHGRFEADGHAIGIGGHAVHAQQAAARRDAEQARLGLGRIHDVDVRIRNRGNDALRLQGGVDRAGEVETVRPAQAARRHSQAFDRRGPVIEKAQSRKIEHRRARRHAQCFGLVEGRVAVFEGQDARAGDQAPHPRHLRETHERRQAVADLAAAHLPAAAFVRLEETALGEHLQGPPHGEARESQRVAEGAFRG